jgi:hypothetical protein
MMRVCLWLVAAQVAIASAAFAQTGRPGQRASDGQGTRPDRQPPPSRATAPEAKPWTIFGTASNGLASNVNFDQEDLSSYGLVLAGGVGYAGDDFEVTYELGGHAYTNTTRWDRISQRIEASYEWDLTGNWELETIGQLGFKGSSEDRDIVDQDLEFMPRLEYRFSPERRLRLFTAHRLKRYHDAPETNAVKHYIGGEFRETLGPRRHWEIGGRFETNDEGVDRGDYRRWTYWLEHGIPLTARDALTMQIRYRLKRYTQRYVEIEDEDVLRTDHRFVPSVAWIHTLSPRFELRFDYTHESNYSNDAEKEYGAHIAWSSLGVRW